MKINFKIFLGFLIGSSILIATLSIIFYNDLFNILTNQNLSEKKQEIVLQKSVIEDALKDFEGETFFLSELSNIEKYITATNESQKIDKANEISNDFTKFIDKHTAYKQVLFLNETGDPIAHSSLTKLIEEKNGVKKDDTQNDVIQNQKNRYYFVETMKLKKGQIFVSLIKDGSKNTKTNDQMNNDVKINNRLIFRYSVPIFDKYNNFKGIIVTDAFAEKIFKNFAKDNMDASEFLRTIDKSNNNKVYIIDNKGRYLHNEDYTKEWDFTYDSSNNISKDLPIIGDRVQAAKYGQFFDEKNGTFATFYRFKPFTEKVVSIHMGDHQHTLKEAELYTSPNNEDVYWTIVFITEEMQILNKVNILFYKTLSLLFLILTVFIISMMWFLRIIIIDPLEKLRHGTQRIKQGNLDYQLEIGNKKDEIGELASEFNSMAIVLKQYKMNMETQVEKRTADLEKFKLAVENAFDCVTITDQEGTILYVNKSTERTTGFTKREIIGKKIDSPDLWSGLMSKEFYEDMWKTIKTEKKGFLGEVKNKNKNGEQYNSLLSITPILDKQHNILFFVNIEKDMSNVTKENY